MTGDIPALLRELADELDCYIGHQYQRESHGVHPAMRGRYERDMQIVHRARRVANEIAISDTGMERRRGE